jgi:hypothetical protein
MVIAFSATLVGGTLIASADIALVQLAAAAAIAVVVVVVVVVYDAVVAAAPPGDLTGRVAEHSCCQSDRLESTMHFAAGPS